MFSKKKETETMSDEKDKQYDEQPADAADSDSDDYDPSSYSCWHVVSNVIFVIAACFYLALAITVLPETRFYKNVPSDVLYATDDATWWNYYNETDAFPPEVLNATDDYTWSLWYNESFYQGDDTVFVVNEAKADTTAVNQYMILYFIAAFGFLCSGLLETCLAENCKYKIMYMVFVIAAGFGVASSMLVVADPNMASVLNAVSVHLFALEAISAVVKTCTSDRNYLLIVGHLSLVVGTMMDVVLSYYYVFESAGLPHARTATAAACFWLLCALIYLWSSIKERQYARESENNGKSLSDSKNEQEGDVAQVF